MPRLLFLLVLALSTPLARADDAIPALPAPSLPTPVPAITETKSTQLLVPGVELTTIHRTSPDAPNAPLQLFITKVDPKAGGKDLKYKLKLSSADYSVLKFATVSQIAKRDEAIVAVNGGYFAFGGAALGAVKIDDEWIRLPIMNRTAVGFDVKGGVLIDSVGVWPQVRRHYPQGSYPLSAPNMNGMMSDYLGDDDDDENKDRSPKPYFNLNGYAPLDGIAVITPRFGNSYKLRPDEVALEIEKEITSVLPDGTKVVRRSESVVARIETGVAQLKPGHWLLVVHGKARASIQEVVIGQEFFGLTFGIIDLSPQWQKYSTILGAGPRLLKNGEIFTTEKEEAFRPDVIARGPRTAFGVDKDGHWIFLVADGRAPEYSVGLTIPELAQEMKNAGALEALCFDGGGSSTLAVNGEVLNRPSDGAERKVPNALCVVPVGEPVEEKK